MAINAGSGQTIIPADTALDQKPGALEARDIEAFAEIDLPFHGLIVEMSGFKLLRRICCSLDGLGRQPSEADPPRLIFPEGTWTTRPTTRA